MESDTKSLRPFAIYDRRSSSWRTPPRSVGAKVGSTLYSATWPKSGMTRTGQAFERPTSERPTGGSESSYSPIGSEPASLRGLPTPLARDWKTPTPADPQRRARHGIGLPSAISELLPTPQARDDSRAGCSPASRKARGHQVNLPDAVTTFLPTPAGSNPNDGEDPTGWLLRRARHRARRINGNGMGMPLSIAVRLLPTPRASDTGTPGRRASTGFRPPLSQEVLPLFPTPRGTEGTKGSPNQRGSKGDLTLSSAVVRLLPAAHQATVTIYNHDAEVE